MKRVADGIYSWAVFSEEKQLDFNGYYAQLPGGITLIDPPPPSPADLEEMASLGAPEAIIITNVNHVRDAVALKERFGARLLVPAADSGSVDCPVDGTYSGGDDVQGLKAVQVPDGKSPGETALYWGERKLLFIGDAVIGKPAGRLSMLPDAKFSDPVRARRGVQVLADLEVETLLLGDGEPIMSEGSRLLGELARS